MMILSQPTARRSRGFILALVALAGAFVHSNLRADMPAGRPPRLPETHWKRDEAPNLTHVIVAGASLSVALALAGVLVARWRGLRSSAIRWTLVVFMMLAIAGVVFGTVQVRQWVQTDDEKWKHYDEEDRKWQSQPIGRSRRPFEEKKRSLERAKTGKTPLPSSQPAP